MKVSEGERGTVMQDERRTDPVEGPFSPSSILRFGMDPSATISLHEIPEGGSER